MGAYFSKRQNENIVSSSKIYAGARSFRSKSLPTCGVSTQQKPNDTTYFFHQHEECSHCSRNCVENEMRRASEPANTRAILNTKQLKKRSNIDNFMRRLSYRLSRKGRAPKKNSSPVQNDLVQTNCAHYLPADRTVFAVTPFEPFQNNLTEAGAVSNGVVKGPFQQGASCAQRLCLFHPHSSCFAADNDDDSDSDSGSVYPLSHIPRCSISAAPPGFLTVTQLYNTMNDGHQMPFIHDPLRTLIVDSRSQTDYDESHIITAKPRSFLNNVASRRNTLLQYGLVLLYDLTGSVAMPADSILQLKRKLSVLGIDAYCLQGGFQEFSTQFPFFCTAKLIFTDDERKKHIKTYPSCVLPRALYIGRGSHATDSDIIDNLHISHVVNISMEHPNMFPSKCQYLTMRLKDDKDSDVLSKFSESSAFIRQAIRNGGRVLVHCNLGISRSSSIMVAFLMRRFHWNISESLEYLKECRSVIRPNRSFLNQLANYEKSLYGESLTTTNLESLVS